MTVCYLLLGVVGTYAVLGNFVAYIMLVSRGVPVRAAFVGMPGYLYRACMRATPPVSVPLQRFCFSIGIAFLAAMLLGLGAAGFAQ